MKVLVASDLHFDHQRDGGRALINRLAPADVLCLPGDLSGIGLLKYALHDLVASGRWAHIVFLSGNHEFYGSNFAYNRSLYSALATEHKDWPTKSPSRPCQLHILDNSTCEIEGQRFVGSTLWFRRAEGIEKLHKYLGDFRWIERADPEIYEENQRALEFLDATVRSSDIVLTHHLPAAKSIAPKYEGSPINCFFLCDIEPLLMERQPRWVLHGHTHSSCRYRLGDAEVVCNPYGYENVPGDLNPEFDPALLLDV